jgi:hypothetical protein
MAPYIYTQPDKGAKTMDYMESTTPVNSQNDVFAAIDYWRQHLNQRVLLRHRIILTYTAMAENISTEDVVRIIVSRVAVP